jgi:hypothetical protein
VSWFLRCRVFILYTGGNVGFDLSIPGQQVTQFGLYNAYFALLPNPRQPSVPTECFCPHLDHSRLDRCHARIFWSRCFCIPTGGHRHGLTGHSRKNSCLCASGIYVIFLIVPLFLLYGVRYECTCACTGLGRLQEATCVSFGARRTNYGGKFGHACHDSEESIGVDARHLPYALRWVSRSLGYQRDRLD